MPNDARLGVTLGVLMTLLLGLILFAQSGNEQTGMMQQILRNAFVGSLDQYLKPWPASTSEP